MAGLRFVNNAVCPFAHRAWLTLLELGLPFEELSADLKNKQSWFSELYAKALGADAASNGKVPIIDDDGFVLTESSPIVYYLLDKYSPGKLPSLQDPQERARAAIFADQVIPKVISGFYGVLTGREDSMSLLAALSNLSRYYSKHEGPYFAGSELSSADILVFPWIARFGCLAHYRGFNVPQTEEYAAYHRFVAAMNERPAVKASVSPDAFYIDGYASYANPPKPAA